MLNFGWVLWLFPAVVIVGISLWETFTEDRREEKLLLLAVVIAVVPLFNWYAMSMGLYEMYNRRKK